MLRLNTGGSLRQGFPPKQGDRGFQSRYDRRVNPKKKFGPPSEEDEQEKRSPISSKPVDAEYSEDSDEELS